MYEFIETLGPKMKETQPPAENFHKRQSGKPDVRNHGRPAPIPGSCDREWIVNGIADATVAVHPARLKNIGAGSQSSKFARVFALGGRPVSFDTEEARLIKRRSGFTFDWLGNRKYECDLGRAGRDFH